MAQPIATLLQVIGLARQPFVSDVLPMYAVFIGLAPLAIRWARAQPLAFVCGSVALWIMSPTLLPLLPSSEPRGWSFNPFAWQLMFGMGCWHACGRTSCCRSRPSCARLHHRSGGGDGLHGAAYLWMRPHVYEAWLPAWLPTMVFPLPKQSLAACAWSASWGWHGWSIWPCARDGSSAGPLHGAGGPDRPAQPVLLRAGRRGVGGIEG
jgi:hypothetical protein